MLRPTLHIPKLVVTTYSKSGLEVREGFDQLEDATSLFQRVHSYLGNIDRIIHMQPLTRAWATMLTSNWDRIDPAALPRTAEIAQMFLAEVRGKAVENTGTSRALRRLYSDFISIRLAMPDKPVRNLFQNLAFYPDRSQLFDPRNKALDEPRMEYFHRMVSEQIGLERDYFMHMGPPIHLPKWLDCWSTILSSPSTMIRFSTVRI